MAIEYSLVLDTSESPSELVELLKENLQMQSKGNFLDTVASDGIVCVVLPQSELGRELVEQAFRISSSICIVCTIDKFDLYDLGMDRLIRICTLLLSNKNCDMVMLSNGESGLLLRRAGEIIVDCRDQYWKERWTSEFLNCGISAVERALPSL